jgi:hypothetical protein
VHAHWAQLSMQKVSTDTDSQWAGRGLHCAQANRNSSKFRIVRELSRLPGRVSNHPTPTIMMQHGKWTVAATVLSLAAMTRANVTAVRHPNPRNLRDLNVVVLHEDSKFRNCSDAWTAYPSSPATTSVEPCRVRGLPRPLAAYSLSHRLCSSRGSCI